MRRLVKASIIILLGFFLYIAVLVIYPRALAYKNGVEYVAGINLVESIPRRGIYPGHDTIAYVSGYSPFKLSLIDKHRKVIESIIGPTKTEYSIFFDYAEKKYVIVTWINPWGQKVDDMPFTICKINEVGSQQLNTLDISIAARSFGIIDYKNGMLLAAYLRREGVDDLTTGVFVIDEKNSKTSMIAEADEQDAMPAPGVFWNDGVIYQKDGDIVYLSKQNGTVDIAHVDNRILMEFLSDKHSIAWFPHFWSYESPIDPEITWYRPDQTIYKTRGSSPHLIEDGILMVRKDSGIYFVDKHNNIQHIHDAKSAWSPVYFNGKLYWSETHVNLAYPLHELWYLMGLSDTKASLKHTFIYSKSVVLPD